MALRRASRAGVDATLPRLLSRGGGSFLRAIEGSSALRARARFALEKSEAALAEKIAEESASPSCRALAKKRRAPVTHFVTPEALGLQRTVAPPGYPK
jgi:hypothetical protein